MLGVVRRECIIGDTGRQGSSRNHRITRTVAAEILAEQQRSGGQTVVASAVRLDEQIDPDTRKHVPPVNRFGVPDPDVGHAALQNTQYIGVRAALNYRASDLGVVPIVGHARYGSKFHAHSLVGTSGVLRRRGKREDSHFSLACLLSASNRIFHAVYARKTGLRSVGESLVAVHDYGSPVGTGTGNGCQFVKGRRIAGTEIVVVENANRDGDAGLG